jgi:hypothetical protein
MLAREDDILMIPVIGTGFGGIEEGIIPSMVVWDNTSSWFESVAMLVGECAILALVSVQEACCSTPMTGDSFSSFWRRWVVVRLGGTGE